MSKITLRIPAPCDFIRVVKIVRPITNQSIADIRQAIDGHLPLVEKDLFFNDHDEIANAFRQLLDALKKKA